MLDRRKENKSAFSTLAYQGLEPRQLLTSVTLVDGLLTIGATTSGSVISLVQLNNSGLLQLTENGENAGQFAPEDVDRVSFFGTPGEDSFTILGNDNSSGSGNDAIDNLMAINFFGGGGDDEFIAQLGDFGSTEILANGGDGNDRLIAESFDGLASSGSGNAQTTLRFFGGDGQDDLRSTGVAIGTTRLIGGGDTDTILGGLADDFLRGGSGNDSIRGGGGGDLLIGDEGDDSLDGEDGDDNILDNLGNDILTGGTGSDWIFGGVGDDVINGSAGIDRLLGGSGDDSIFGDGGNDSIVGGNGDDTITGGDGDDRVAGSAGNDTLNGGDGKDTLFGGAGLDSLFGEADDDFLGGGFGSDRLTGGSGDDVLLGHEDNDVLDGGTGADFLDGGTEDDELFGGTDTTEDSLLGRSGRDTFIRQNNEDQNSDFDSREDLETTTKISDDGPTILSTDEDFTSVRVAFFNLLFGSNDVAAQNAHLDRVQADILGLSEITESDIPQIESYAAANGYQPPLYADYVNGHFLTQVLLTKYPVLFSETVPSGAGANEFIRPPIYAELDIDGTRTGVYVIHSQTLCNAAPCDTSVPVPALEFSRAIEGIRIAEHQASRLALFPELETILVGDHNEDPATPQTASFASPPAGLPPWYSLGSDIAFPISYAGYVGNFHSSLGLQTLNSTDLDGNDSTLFAITPNQAITTENKIDFIATSSGIQVDGHEVLNSEATQSGGLEKFGDELPFSSSRSASDHKLIFADLRI